jgi:Ni/Co efflux regulator RcnB
MKTKSLIPVLLVLALSASTVTFAKDHGNNGRGNDNGRGYDNGERRNDRNDRDDDRRGPPKMQGRHDNGRHNGERGAGPEHSYYRGERLPAYYRSNQYVVNDWRGHRLSAPPRGYHWVQTGGDYVLVAIATGLSLNMIINN